MCQAHLRSCARKVSKTSRRTGLNSLPSVEQPALSISTSGASSPAKTQDGGSQLPPPRPAGGRPSGRTTILLSGICVLPKSLPEESQSCDNNRHQDQAVLCDSTVVVCAL